MLPDALVCGIKIDEFWELTYGEISLYITAYQKRREMELKERAIMDYKLGDLIGISAGRLMDSKCKYPQIEEVYPNFFEEVVKEKPKQDWEKQKEILMNYANAHNQKFNK